MHGLLAFHRQETIHRDIKPENIIIDTSHTLKLIDFGSARIAGIEEISKPIDNRTTVIGTVNYSAPELLSGGPGTVRSDYYSVGVIAYEMLTGKLPYGNELSVRKLQRAEYRPVSRYNSEIPDWIDCALRKCVSKNPLNRYELLSEFIFDLSTPNKEFSRAASRPLIERNPLRFWQWLAGFSLLLNLLLFLWLVK
jgi:serine/threonine protein kinase